MKAFTIKRSLMHVSISFYSVQQIWLLFLTGYHEILLSMSHMVDQVIHSAKFGIYLLIIITTLMSTETYEL